MQRRDLLLTAAAANRRDCYRNRHPRPPTNRREKFAHAMASSCFTWIGAAANPWSLSARGGFPAKCGRIDIAHLGSHGVRCIAFDRRGHGRSDIPGYGYDLDTLADDLAAVIEQLDLHRRRRCRHVERRQREFCIMSAGTARSRISKIFLLAPTTPFVLKTEDNPYGAPKEYFEQLWQALVERFPEMDRRQQAAVLYPGNFAADNAMGRRHAARGAAAGCPCHQPRDDLPSISARCWQRSIGRC